MRIAALLITLFLFSCKPVYLPYRSTATNDRHTVNTKTDLTRIGGNTSFFGYLQYAVYSGIDYSPTGKPSGYYILLCPSNGASLEKTFLWMSASVLPSDAASMLEVVDKIIQEWDAPTDGKDAYFYRFHTKIQMPVPVVFFPDPLAWVPSAELTCNRTERGSLATLLIGSEEWQLRYFFEDREDMEHFRDLIKEAIADLKKKGMP
jgi:hypothetical protein